MYIHVKTTLILCVFLIMTCEYLSNWNYHIFFQALLCKGTHAYLWYELVRNISGFNEVQLQSEVKNELYPC